MQLQKQTEEYSFYSPFIPLTKHKAIWIIVLIGIIVFFNMLFNGFVWDDQTYIVFNPQIHVFNFQSAFLPNLFNKAGQYRPISVLYFSLLYTLFQNTTFYYHTLQLILHLVNTILLFLIFDKFFSKRLSLFLSLIFLVHPIQVESVSYISASDSPLFFFFGINALLLSFKEHISQKKFIAISGLLLLSLLSKETGLLFFPAIILNRFLLQRKVHVKNLFIFITYEFLAVCIYFYIRFVIGHTGMTFVPSGRIPINNLSLPERLINIPAIVLYYLKTFIFPKDLVIEQNWVFKTVDFAHFYLPLAIDIFFFLFWLAVSIYIWKKKKEYEYKIFLFFFLWFIIGLLFHIQLYPLDMTVADRWFYFPMVGLLGMIGALLSNIKTSKSMLWLGYILASLIIILFSIRTIVRNANWSNAITLYTHDLKIYDNYDLESALGVEYSNIQQYDKALEASKKAVKLFPYEATYYNLANTYETVGDKKLAEKYYIKAIHSYPYLPIGHKHFAVTYVRLSYLLYLDGNYTQSLKVAKNGLSDYPVQPYLWIESAACEYMLGNQLQALVFAAKAKSLSPTAQIVSLYSQIANKKPLNLKL